MRARRVSVTLAGRNLALWTRYRGADPEVNATVGSKNNGAYYDVGGVPVSTYWIGRVNIGL
jgi:hypothetical protein